MQIWITKEDAVNYAVLPALGEDAADFDVDAIFAEAFVHVSPVGGAQRAGFAQAVDTDGFWRIAEKHAR